MKKEFLKTDFEVEQEIEKLRNSENVKLAEKEQRMLYKRRRYMYQLRLLEKRGKQLSKMGITMDNIEDKLFFDKDDFEG